MEGLENKPKSTTQEFIEAARQKRIILQTVTEQDDLLYKLVNDERQKERNPEYKKTVEFERAKMIGMLVMLDLLAIDRSKFNWIFTI